MSMCVNVCVGIYVCVSDCTVYEYVCECVHKYMCVCVSECTVYVSVLCVSVCT